MCFSCGYALVVFAVCAIMGSTSPGSPERERKGTYNMSDTKRREITKTGRKAEETRARVRESLYKAKASGALTEDDEAELLRYAQGVVAMRGKKPRE